MQKAAVVVTLTERFATWWYGSFLWGYPHIIHSDGIFQKKPPAFLGYPHDELESPICWPGVSMRLQGSGQTWTVTGLGGRWLTFLLRRNMRCKLGAPVGGAPVRCPSLPPSLRWRQQNHLMKPGRSITICSIHEEIWRLLACRTCHPCCKTRWWMVSDLRRYRWADTCVFTLYLSVHSTSLLYWNAGLDWIATRY